MAAPTGLPVVAGGGGAGYTFLTPRIVLPVLPGGIASVPGGINGKVAQFVCTAGWIAFNQ